MPVTVRAPGAYPDAPPSSEPAPAQGPSADEAAAALRAAEQELERAKATGNQTLINRALAALASAQKAYDEAVAEAEGRRVRVPWGDGARESREQLPTAPEETQQQVPVDDKPQSSTAIWWMLGLLAAAGVAGAVWYSRRESLPVQNPYPRRKGKWMTKTSAEAQWKSWYLPDVIDWEKRNHGGLPESHMRLASWNRFLQELIEEGRISEYHADRWAIPKEVGW